MSANSTTNPHAVSLVSPFVHSLLFAILTVCVPNVPKSTSFVSPTLYLLVFPYLTLAAIVAQLSLENETGDGVVVDEIRKAGETPVDLNAST